MQAVVESLSTRRKTNIPIAIPEKRTISVASQAARSGMITKKPING